jgi:hypothetical protein
MVVNNELESRPMEEEATVAYFQVHDIIYLSGLRKPMKITWQNIRYPGQDSNVGLIKYKTLMSTTTPQISVAKLSFGEDPNI